MTQKVHLYQIIYNDIKERILSRELQPGDMLPSENELVNLYATTRVTIKKSLTQLEHEGFIYSRQGKGSFVSKPENNRYTMYYNLENPSMQVKVTKIEIVVPDEELRKTFKIKGFSSMIQLKRILFKDENPIAYDIKNIPYETGMPLIEEEIRYADFPMLVSKKISPFKMRSTISFSAMIPTEEIIKNLNLNQNDAVLVATRLIYDDNGILAGQGVTYFPGNVSFIKAFTGQ